MRKILLGLIIAALTIFTIKVVYQGNSFGSLDIWGVKEISEKNDDIDAKNSQLSNLTKITFPETLSKLTQSSEVLQQTKKQYEEKAILLSKNKYYRQTEKYKHEFLLTKIGNYADENNIDVKIVVTNSHTPSLYDINFKVTGKYTDVANYIYDIENDSKLGFKIEDFSMASGSATIEKADGTNESVSGVTASFNCKEISIDLKGVEQQTEQKEESTGESIDKTGSNVDTNNTNKSTDNVNNTNTISGTTTENNTLNTESSTDSNAV